jgi:hypothetical protein
MTVAACATVRATAKELPSLRKVPGPSLGEPLSPAFLKNADEQTVVSVAAVLQAAHRGGWTANAFADWGVIAAPRFLGRQAMVEALPRFRSEGAWAISPHLIPNRSLHAVSGTISQALKAHGPNFGVGSGRSSVGEAVLTAATLLSQSQLPGLWLVCSGWDREPVGQHEQEPACLGVALALVPEDGDRKLSIGPGSIDGDPLTLELLWAAVATSAVGRWPASQIGWVTLGPTEEQP